MKHRKRPTDGARPDGGRYVQHLAMARWHSPAEGHTTWIRLQWVQLRTAWRMLWPTHQVIVIELGPAVVCCKATMRSLARNHRPNSRASLIPSWRRGRPGVAFGVSPRSMPQAG